MPVCNTSRGPPTSTQTRVHAIKLIETFLFRKINLTTTRRQVMFIAKGQNDRDSWSWDSNPQPSDL